MSLYPPLPAKAQSVLDRLDERRRAGEHSFDSWYHIRCTDEVPESNRMTDGVPGGAHPTAGAPSSYLEDEAR